MKTIQTAIIGTGFLGRVHLEAVRRLEFVDVVAIAGRDAEAAGKGPARDSRICGTNGDARSGNPDDAAIARSHESSERTAVQTFSTCIYSASIFSASIGGMS